jgi:hypothetical protein
MLIVPASKVSVPLTVVMRTRSRVAESVFEPAVDLFVTLLDSEKLPLATQMFPLILQIVIEP